MRYPTFVLFSLLLFSCPTFGQDVTCYLYKLGEAQFQLSQKNYTESQQWLMAAEKEKVYKGMGFYLIGAEIYATLSDTLKTFSYLKQAIIHGTKWKAIERRMEDYPAFLHSSKWKNLAQEYPVYRQQYTSKLDIDAYTLLVKMGADDQAIRRYKSYNRADTLVNKYMVRIDSINLVKLKTLIEESGFPTMEKVGLEGYITLHLVLLHGLTDHTWAWSFFEPVLLEAVQTGKLLPQHYANIIDRRLLWGLGKPQYYGSFNWKDGKLTAFNEIAAVATVDERRWTIGLRTLEEYAQKQEWALPVGYVKMAANNNCD